MNLRYVSPEPWLLTTVLGVRAWRRQRGGERDYTYIFVYVYCPCTCSRVSVCVDVCLCTRFSVCTSGERPRALRPAQREKGDAAGQNSGSVTEICLSSPQTVQLKKSQSPLVHYYQLGFYTHLFTGLIYEPLS